MIKVGTQVEIINYGSLLWSQMDLSFKKLEDGVYDLDPQLVGQRGIVVDAHLTQGKPTYALSGPSKHAWYNDDQLKILVEPQYL